MKVNTNFEKSSPFLKINPQLQLRLSCTGIKSHRLRLIHKLRIYLHTYNRDFGNNHLLLKATNTSDFDTEMRYSSYSKSIYLVQRLAPEMNFSWILRIPCYPTPGSASYVDDSTLHDESVSILALVHWPGFTPLIYADQRATRTQSNLYEVWITKTPFKNTYW